MKKILFSIACMLMLSLSQAYAEADAEYFFQRVGEAGMKINGSGYDELRWFQNSGSIAIYPNNTLHIKYNGQNKSDIYKIKRVQRTLNGFHLDLEQTEVMTMRDIGIDMDDFEMTLEYTLEIVKNKNGGYNLTLYGAMQVNVFSCAWATFNNK